MTATRVGLDLHDPHVRGLVRRLYYSRLVVLVEAEGLDRDDGLQELFLRLMQRQTRPRSAFTASRGRQGTYIFQAGRSALLDWLKAERRLRARDGEPAAERDAALEGA